MVRNVHERVLDAGIGEVGGLLEGLAGPDDRFWPRDRWPPMRLNRELAVGAEGGHGPIRYRVSDVDPGRRVSFRFADDFPVDGHHWLELFTRDGHTVLRHVVEAQPRGRMRLLWPLAIRWLHDALVEDALDSAEAAVQGRRPARPRLSPWVRALRRAASSGRL